MDRVSPARHVAAELGRVFPEALPLSALAGSYVHPNPGDLSRVQENERTADPARFLIIQALNSLGGQVIWEGHNKVRMSKTAHEKGMVFQGRPLNPARNDSALLRAPFDPNIGMFSRGLRDNTVRLFSDPELIDSLRAFGWVPEFPAIRDERGVVLAGKRRLAAVEKLAAEGITVEPAWLTLTLGHGDEADARRFAIAIASNVGSKPFSPTERARIAEYLYGDRAWDVARIGQALGVSKAQVYRDLNRSDSGSRNSHAEKSESDSHVPAGRSQFKEEPVYQRDTPLNRELRDTIRAGGKLDRKELTARYGVSSPALGSLAQLIEAEERGRALGRAEAQDEPATLPDGDPALMELREKIRLTIDQMVHDDLPLTLQGVCEGIGYSAEGSQSKVQRAWDGLAAEGLAPPRPTGPRAAGANHVHRWVCEGCGSEFRTH